MIVKNEEKIIVRALTSIFPYIDSYCICDTGSTDNTIQLIEQFFGSQEIQKPGKVMIEPFRDFGYNRTFSLNQCESVEPEKSQYVLLIDADMKFECTITPEAFRAKLSKDMYFIFQGTSDFFYKNARIAKNRAGFSYWGVTHEYLKAPLNKVTVIDQYERDECFIADIGDGGCKEKKYERDITLLKKGLEENPDDPRYTFYLANSYMSLNNYVDAIKYFDMRVLIDGWHEEVWHSHYSAAVCHQHIGNREIAVYRHMEAYRVFPSRMENIYEIVKHYRSERGRESIAYFYYKLADEIRNKNRGRSDFLFWQSDVYTYKLDYEMSIIGYYHNPDKLDMTALSMRLIRQSPPDDSMHISILSNFKFYAEKLCSIAKKQIEVCLKVNPLLDIGEGYKQSTPTMCWEREGNDILLFGVRYVNYYIDDNGVYVNKEHIVSKMVFMKISPDISSGELLLLGDSYLVKHNESRNGRYIGPEDIRIMRTKTGSIIYNANRCTDSGGECKIEHGYLGNSANASILSKDTGMASCEKNWVLFDIHDDVLHRTYCVYQWSPFELGYIQDGAEFVTISQQNELPYFFKSVRGSTNGVTVGDEIWFLCHMVNYEDRRYYYHLMIIFDPKTMRIIKYTPLFTFHGEKVEYSLGFVYKQADDTVLIGYSKNDRDTHLMEVERSRFVERMISI